MIPPPSTFAHPHSPPALLLKLFTADYSQPGHMLQSWTPTSRQLSKHGFPPISNQRFAGIIVGSDGMVWCGTHPNGHLTSFDPATGSWEDHGYLGQEEPAEASPGVVQQVWCYPRGLTAAGEVVATHNCMKRPTLVLQFCSPLSFLDHS